MKVGLWLLSSLIPLTLLIAPQGGIENLFFLSALAVGSSSLLFPKPHTLAQLSFLSLGLFYITGVLKTKKKDKELLMLLSPLASLLLLAFPQASPLGSIALGLFLVLLMDNISHHYPSLPDRCLLLSITVMPLLLTVLLYLPLALHRAEPRESSTLLVSWALNMEATNLFALLALWKGTFFKAQLDPSAEIKTKGLAFILFITYVLAVVILELIRQHHALLEIIQLTLLTGTVLTAVALSWKKGIMIPLKRYLLIHLYREPLDFYRLVATLHQSASHKPWPQVLEETLERALKTGPLLGIQANLTSAAEPWSLKKGEMSNHKVTVSSPIPISGETLNLTAFFSSPPDQREKEGIQLLADLLSSFLAMVKAQEERTLQEKFQLMEKLRGFIAHDLKNLGQAVKLYQENLPLLLEAPPHEQRETLRELLDTVESKITKAVKTLTSPSPTPLKRETFQLRETLEKLINALPFKERIHLEVEPLEITTDRAMLTTVLENLLFNAYQKDPEKIDITVKAWSSDGQVFIEVADNGPPIPQNLRRKIFEPFFSTKPGGLGLGLYMVREYLRALQGDIELRSSSQETAFRIILPQRV